MSFWRKLADMRDRQPGEKQSTVIGYEIALCFVPPHNNLLVSHLLSKMLLLCCEAGSSLQKKATTFLTTARQIQEGHSQVVFSLPS